jgi:hypothetical protein
MFFATNYITQRRLCPWCAWMFKVCPKSCGDGHNGDRFSSDLMAAPSTESMAASRSMNESPICTRAWTWHRDPWQWWILISGDGVIQSQAVSNPTAAATIRHLDHHLGEALAPGSRGDVLGSVVKGSRRPKRGDDSPISQRE